MIRESVGDVVGQLREWGAEVFHLSWGAAGHGQEWYCSASRSNPSRSVYTEGDTLAEALVGTYEQVRAWPRPVAVAQADGDPGDCSDWAGAL